MTAVDKEWEKVRQAKCPVTGHSSFEVAYDTTGLRDQLLHECPFATSQRYLHNDGFLFKANFASTYSNLPSGDCIVRLSYADGNHTISGMGIRWFPDKVNDDNVKDLLFIGPTLAKTRDNFSLLYTSTYQTGVAATVVSAATPYCGFKSDVLNPKVTYPTAEYLEARCVNDTIIDCGTAVAAIQKRESVSFNLFAIVEGANNNVLLGMLTLVDVDPNMDHSRAIRFNHNLIEVPWDKTASILDKTLRYISSVISYTAKRLCRGKTE
jgi:hypothetical protein